MATETTGRLICSLGASAVASDSTSESWQPAALTPSQPDFPSLPMHWVETPSNQKRVVREETAQYLPEPGMVLIYSGAFIMGDEDGSRDEQPQRTVTLPAYWIDKFPVTNAEYKAFVDTTGHRRPPSWTNGTYRLEEKNHPVTNVNWEDAHAYAQWVGKGLPTEAEWEKAARGTVGQTYPWGDAFRKDNVNSSNDYGGTTPVDQFAGGVSPYDVVDMVGNVQEWCEDWYYDDYYKRAPVDHPTGPDGGQYRVCRGGFYAENRMGIRCSQRHYAPPETMQDHIGFRCAKTPVRPGEQVPKPKVEHNVIKQVDAPAPVQRPELTDALSVDQIAEYYPENVAKVLRTMIYEASDEDRKGVIKKIAILFIGVGQTVGATICKYLTDVEIERISQAIVECDVVTQQQKDDVFGEIKHRVLSGSYLMQGGEGFARGMLEKALGPRKMKVIFGRVNSTTGSGFYLLRNVDPNQIVPFISKEHPQTIALILSQLDSTQAAGVLNGLPDELQSDVAFRIAQMDNINPQVLRELESGLARDLQNILSGQITEIGGPKAVAEILNRSGRTTEKNVIERIDKQDSTLGEQIRNQMFVYDDIANLTDREIQLVLDETDFRDLAVGLKGANEALQARIFKIFDDEKPAKLKEEIQFSGPVRMSDVEEVQLRTVKTVRQLEEAGKITIVRGDSNDVFV
jgi:flagellar motor switch protein FliG